MEAIEFLVRGVCVCVEATPKEVKVEMELAEMESEENSLLSGGEQRWR